MIFGKNSHERGVGTGGLEPADVVCEAGHGC